MQHEAITVLDVDLRLESADRGAFYPGAVVRGVITLFNQSQCPFGCWPFELPFSVRIP